MAAAAAAPAPSINRSSAEPVAAPGCFRWVRLCARCVCAVCAVPQSGTERSPGSAPLCPQSCGRWGPHRSPARSCGRPSEPCRASADTKNGRGRSGAVRCGNKGRKQRSAPRCPTPAGARDLAALRPLPPPSHRAFPVMQPGLPPPGYGAPSRPARGAPRPAPLRPRHRRPFKAPPRPPLPAASDRSARPP